MIDFEKLKREQQKLSAQVILQDGFRKVETVAGIDQAYVGTEVISCIVVCDSKTMEVRETQTARKQALVPYKPGFLAYREMPAMVEAYHQLQQSPDVILVDGHGIAHPRRLGLASHFGIVLGKPTIGIAKSLVTGAVEQGKIYVESELRGFEVKTKEHATPLYISPGHLVGVGTALKIVRDCIRPPHKLPEPLHLAHRCAKNIMKKEEEKKLAKVSVS